MIWEKYKVDGQQEVLGTQTGSIRHQNLIANSQNILCALYLALVYMKFAGFMQILRSLETP